MVLDILMKDGLACLIYYDTPGKICGSRKYPYPHQNSDGAGGLKSHTP